MERLKKKRRVYKVTNLDKAAKNGNIDPFRNVEYSLAFVHPLTVAARHNQLEVVRYLVETHAMDREAALFAACEKGHTELVRYLVVGYDNSRALAKAFRRACKHNRIDLVRLLYTRSAASSLDGYGLSVAVKNDFHEIVEFLIERGHKANKNDVAIAQNMKLWTTVDLSLPGFLHAAVRHNWLEGAKVAVEAGAQVYYHMLKKGVSKQYYEVTKYLLSLRSDYSNEILEVVTSLQIVKLLVESGKFQFTPRQFLCACRYQNLDVIKYMRETLQIPFILKEDAEAAAQNYNTDVFVYAMKFNMDNLSDIFKSTYQCMPAKTLRWVFDNHMDASGASWGALTNLYPNEKNTLMGYKLQSTEWVWDSTKYKYLPTRLQKTIMAVMIVIRARYRPIYKDMRRRIVDEIVEAYGH